MSYNCVVCVKQVLPEGQAAGAAGSGSVLAPDDLHALEAALDVRDRFGGTVTAVTMGTPRSSDALREALYRGADDGVLISDTAADGSDSFATSYVLSCAVRKLNPDIVFCGERSSEGGAAQTGPQIAEKIKFTLITSMSESLDLDDGTATVRRHLEDGSELVEAELPVLITVASRANTPRPPALKRVMTFKRARTRAELFVGPEGGTSQAAVRRECKKLEKSGLLIQSWNLGDIKADPAKCGAGGSLTKVVRVQTIAAATGEYKAFPNTKKGIGALIDELFEEQLSNDKRSG